MSNWYNFGQTINNSFYFVVIKIIDIQDFFITEARNIGKVVLLIAILSAALNYALTGTGLKENIIKILKATLFFLIVTAAYPVIIGWITSYTFKLAEGSVYKSVKEHFDEVIEETEVTYNIEVHKGNATADPYGPNPFHSITTAKSTWLQFTNTYKQITTVDNSGLFKNIIDKVPHTDPKRQYTVIAPAAVIQVILFIANECIGFADNKGNTILPDFSRVIKGLACAFFLIFTGAFALLEYIVCFLEFMLVASVGIILFPMSIWEGSKFMAEKFIGAIIGFFMKLLFCNLSIFLMLYGFISLFYIITAKQGDLSPQGFTGEADQIVFIIFTCLLFYFICKSAPSLAQSLLTGAPSLNAAGAISAVAGAAGAVAATAGFIKSAGGAVKNGVSSVVGGVANTANTFAQAGAAAKAAGDAGGNRMDKAGAFMSSLGKSASQGLARSLYGDRSGQSMGERNAAAKVAGASHGNQYMNNVKQKQGLS